MRLPLQVHQMLRCGHCNMCGQQPLQITLDVVFWNDIVHATLALFSAKKPVQNPSHVS